MQDGFLDSTLDQTNKQWQVRWILFFEVSLIGMKISKTWHCVVDGLALPPKGL